MTEFIKRLTKHDVRNTMAMFWMALSFLFLFKLLSKSIPDVNKDVVMTIAGVVVGQLVGIVSFYFGQSKSEIDKGKADETH